VRRLRLRLREGRRDLEIDVGKLEVELLRDARVRVVRDEPEAARVVCELAQRRHLVRLPYVDAGASRFERLAVEFEREARRQLIGGEVRACERRYRLLDAVEPAELAVHARPSALRKLRVRRLGE